MKFDDALLEVLTEDMDPAVRELYDAAEAFCIEFRQKGRTKTHPGRLLDSATDVWRVASVWRQMNFEPARHCTLEGLHPRDMNANEVFVRKMVVLLDPESRPRLSVMSQTIIGTLRWGRHQGFLAA